MAKVSLRQGLRSLYNSLLGRVKTLEGAVGGKADTIQTLTIPSTTASQELAPNTLYIFASRSTALTLTLGTPIAGIANEYHLFLVADSTTAPTVTWPSGISWNGGDAPTIAADKTYEISILNNVAAFFEI